MTYELLLGNTLAPLLRMPSGLIQPCLSGVINSVIRIFPEKVFKSFMALLYFCLGKSSNPISFTEM